MKTKLLRSTLLFNLLPVVLLLLMGLLLPACEEKNQDDPKPGPRTEVPGRVTRESNGKDQLTIRFEPGQGGGTTFQPARW